MKYKHLHNLLYKSFDSDLTESEKEILEKALSESEKLRKEKEQLISMRKLIASSSQKTFKPLFNERVIQKLNEPKEITNEKDDFIYLLIFSFKRIAIASLVVVVILLSNNIIQAEEVSLESVMGLEKVSVADIFDPTYILTEE